MNVGRFRSETKDELIITYNGKMISVNNEYRPVKPVTITTVA